MQQQPSAQKPFKQQVIAPAKNPRDKEQSEEQKLRVKAEIRQKIFKAINQRQNQNVEKGKVKQQKGVKNSDSGSLPNTELGKFASRASEVSEHKSDSNAALFRSKQSSKTLQLPKGNLVNVNFTKAAGPKFYAPDSKPSEKDFRASAQVFTIHGFNKPENLKKESQQLRARDQQEAKSFFDYFPAFEQRKKRKAGQKIDLKVSTLSEIVDFCYNEKIITEEDYHSYLYNKGPYIEKNYLNSMMHNRLHEFKFSRTRFTLFDHRRLTLFLVKADPTKYKEGDRPFSIHPETACFLRQIYSINIDDYWKKCLRMDKKYNLKWWTQIHANSGIVPHFADEDLFPDGLIRTEQNRDGKGNGSYEQIQPEQQEVCEILPNFKMTKKGPRQEASLITNQGQDQKNKALVRQNKPADQYGDDSGDSQAPMLPQSDSEGQSLGGLVDGRRGKYKTQIAVKKKAKGQDEQEEFDIGSPFREYAGSQQEDSMGDEMNQASQALSKKSYKSSVRGGKALLPKNDDQFFSDMDEEEEEALFNENKKKHKKADDEVSELDLDEIDMESPNQQSEHPTKPKKMVKKND